MEDKRTLKDEELEAVSAGCSDETNFKYEKDDVIIYKSGFEQKTARIINRYYYDGHKRYEVVNIPRSYPPNSYVKEEWVVSLAETTSE